MYPMAFLDEDKLIGYKLFLVNSFASKMLIHHCSDVRLAYNFMQWYCFSCMLFVYVLHK